jgi:hypothetical protein
MTADTILRRHRNTPLSNDLRHAVIPMRHPPLRSTHAGKMPYQESPHYHGMGGAPLSSPNHVTSADIRVRDMHFIDRSPAACSPSVRSPASCTPFACICTSSTDAPHDAAHRCDRLHHARSENYSRALALVSLSADSCISAIFVHAPSAT